MDYLGSTPLPEGREVMPFANFPERKREEIGRLVQEDTPPPKWISLGLCEIVSRAWHEWYWFRGIDPDAKRPKLPTSTRRRVIHRDGYVCGICSGPVDPDDVHIDHIIPWSLGGSDLPSNLQVAHALCNLRKGATL